MRSNRYRFCVFLSPVSCLFKISFLVPETMSWVTVDVLLFVLLGSLEIERVISIFQTLLKIRNFNELELTKNRVSKPFTTP
jgi:hypothetical protein